MSASCETAEVRAQSMQRLALAHCGTTDVFGRVVACSASDANRHQNGERLLVPGHTDKAI